MINCLITQWSRCITIEIIIHVFFILILPMDIVLNYSFFQKPMRNRWFQSRECVPFHFLSLASWKFISPFSYLGKSLQLHRRVFLDESLNEQQGSDCFYCRNSNNHVFFYKEKLDSIIARLDCEKIILRLFYNIWIRIRNSLNFSIQIQSWYVY